MQAELGFSPGLVDPLRPPVEQRLEKGDPTVGIGIVAGALWILGLDRRLGDLVAPESDTTGLQEDINNLPRDFRKTRKRADKYDF